MVRTGRIDPEEADVSYLDSPKMLGNYWSRPVDVHDEEGRGGADEHYAAEEVREGSILEDVAIWSIWVAAALGFIVLVLLLPGIVAGH